MPIDNCGEIISATLDFTEENCNIQLDFKNGESFSFEAGLTEIKKTDCYDTHVVSMQPQDFAVCAATGAWTTENKFTVTAHMLPTHTMFYLVFSFADGKCNLLTKIYRGNEFGISV